MNILRKSAKPDDQKFKQLFWKNQIPKDAKDHAEYLAYLVKVEESNTGARDGGEFNAAAILFAIFVIALLLGGPSLPILLFGGISIFAGMYVALGNIKLTRASFLIAKIKAKQVKHRLPTLSKDAKSTITADIDDKYWHPDYFTEDLAAKKLSDNTYQICAIPFAAAHVALGDVIRVNKHMALEKVISKGDFAAFRIATANKAAQQEAVQIVGNTLDILHESFNDSLLVIAVKKSGADELATALGELEQDGTILEYQRTEDRVNKVAFSKADHAKYLGLFATCFVLQVAGTLIAMYFARDLVIKFFQQVDFSNPQPVPDNFDLKDRLLALGGFGLAVSSLFIQNLLLDRTVFLKRKTSRSEREIKSYTLAALLSALCMPLFSMLFFVAFIFLFLVDNMSQKKPLSGSKIYWRVTLIYIGLVTIAIAAGWAMLAFTTLQDVIPTFIEKIAEQ